MAEKKVEKKKAPAKKAEKTEKKTSKKVGKKDSAEKTGAKTKPEVRVEVGQKSETRKDRKKLDHRGRGGTVCAVLVTFFITALLFGMTFFVFMNLDVIDDHGRVRIEHGKITIDNRHKNCIEVTEDSNKRDDTKTDAEDTNSKNEETGKNSTSPGELIENPNARVTVKGAQLVEVGDLELYLPKDFEASRANGNGKYVYNLSNDDGWADVKIYAEKTTADLLSYMQKKDSLLRITNSAYYMNGTSWAVMESGSSMAYGTRLGDMLYVVILNVKLESDATGDAEQMIPKTIRLKRIYK